MNTHKLSLLITLLIGVLIATACSPSAAEKLNQEGNDAYTQQAYDQALALYQSAQIEEPELAEAYYNAASALYRQGEYAAALEQLQMALSFADDETLAQASFFNLGNSAYNAQDNASAIAAYSEALLRNPDDLDAKVNLELALQQQQEQEQQEQEQQQEQQEQEEQEEQEPDQQQEQQQDQQSEGGEGEEEQESEDPSDGEEGQNEEQDQQEGDDASENGRDSQQEDSEPSENGDQQQDDQPGQGQPQPGQEDPTGEQQPGVVPQPGERMSEEQAKQLLAAIAGNSDTLAERLGEIFAVPWSPPVQDW